MSYDGQIRIDTSINGKGFTSGLSKLGSIAKGAFAGVVTSITAASAALTAGAAYAIKAGMDFEAQMSRVKAISGATTDEFQQLNEQAKQLGADTAFSASQAAEGMENLASAGFGVSEIMKAMPGMLDLAASSGEDLATSSDIAASTLRGFNLAASEAGHVADVLAKNAAQTNAAVVDTGYAMKYVAPVAYTAGWSLESVAAAIGTLANAGIKGEQAGTTLRGALTRLMNPTDKMTEAMDEVGFAVYDTSGKMKPLSQIVAELREKTKDLTDEQRNQIIATIFGTEALSGMQVLLQAGGKSLDEMTESLIASDGAAKEMATTMQDNLKGAIEQLKGSAETLGISLYESIDGPLKGLAQTATEYINQLVEAFKSDGVKGLVSALGSTLADAFTRLAQKAPGIIDMAVSFIKSFVEGVKKNAAKLLDAAKQIVKALVDGLVNLLPSSIQKPIRDMIDGIQKSFESGGLRSAIQTVGGLLKALGDAVVAIASVALPVITWAIDAFGGSLKVLLPIVLGITAAILAWNAVQAVATWWGGLTKAATAAAAAIALSAAATTAEAGATAASAAALTAKSVLVGVLTGKIGLATAAQWLWNIAMNANPIGLIIGAVAALTTVIGGLILAFGSQKTVEEEHLEVVKQETEAVYDLVEVNEKAREAFENKAKSIKHDADSEDALIDTILNLKKVEGKSATEKKILLGYVEQLNKALPGLNLAYDEQADTLSENEKVLRAYVDLQRDQADLENRQEKGIELAKELAMAQADLTTKQTERAAVQRELDALEEKSGPRYTALIQSIWNYDEQIRTLTNDQIIAQTASETNAGAMTTLANQIEASNTIIANSNQNLTKVKADEAAKQKEIDDAAAVEAQKRWQEIYDDYFEKSENFEKIQTERRGQSIKTLTKNLNANTAVMTQWLADLDTLTSKGFDKALVEDLRAKGPEFAKTVRNLTKASEPEIQDFNKSFADNMDACAKAADAKMNSPENTGIGSRNIDANAEGMKNNEALSKASADAVTESKTAMDKAVKDNNFASVGLNMIKGVVQGVKDNLYRLREAMVDMAEAALKAAKDRLKEASPSKAFEKEVGAFIPPGVDIGVDKAMPKTLRNMKQRMTALIQKARDTIASEQSKMNASLSMSTNAQLALAGGPEDSDIIDYDKLARAIWAQAPDMGHDIIMDAQKVARAVEPEVSQIQGDRAARKRR